MALQFAGRLAMIGFAAALLASALARAGVEPALKTALLAGTMFYGLGLVVGEFGRRIAEFGAQAEFDRRSRDSAEAAPPADRTA